MKIFLYPNQIPNFFHHTDEQHLTILLKHVLEVVSPSIKAMVRNGVFPSEEIKEVEWNFFALGMDANECSECGYLNNGLSIIVEYCKLYKNGKASFVVGETLDFTNQWFKVYDEINSG